MMRKSILFFILLMQIAFSYGQFRSYSNEFLNIGVDARAFGMGNAVVANINDVSSTYWNPAGLAQITQDWQAVAMHAEYFQSIAKYDFAAAAIPLDQGHTVGISLYRFGVDGILNTTELIDSQGNIDYERISTFSAADYALQLSYGGNIFNIPNVDFGLNAKLIYRNVGEFANAYGFGLDAGMQYRKDDFAIGVMVRDITSTFNAWSINQEKLNQLQVDGILLNEPPEETIELTLPKIQIGITEKINFANRFSALGELDLNFNLRDGNELISSSGLSFSPAAGVEVGYDEMVFVRAGVNNFQRTQTFDEKQEIQFQPNIGVGFKYRGIAIDYALTDIGDQSIALYSNIFSVKFDMEEFRY